MSKDTRPSRRQALLGDRPGSYAIARQVRISPTKVRRVVDLVRGMDVPDALNTLQFAPQAASEPVYKVIASAASNAEQTANLRRTDLFVSQAVITEAGRGDSSAAARRLAVLEDVAALEVTEDASRLAEASSSSTRFRPRPPWTRSTSPSPW